MSLSSSRFNLLVKEAFNRNDISGTLDAFSAYQSSHCYFPIKQRVYDSHLQEYRTIEVPCGKCYHCLETKINSWVTRMYAHLEDFKHVYFVTLTYRSFTPHFVDGFPQLRPLEQLLQNKLTHAVWHYDNKNSSHRYCYSPCLLCKDHYQRFIKRLRKYTGINDLTYVLTGELGHSFGRPHFHMVLFTNSEITKQDIVRAWSVAMWRDSSGSWSYRTNQRKNGTAFNFPIGGVDFNDLVTNGTLNTSALVKVDNNFMSAAHCFAYVCKYVCKSDDANYSRVDLAFNNLFCPEKMCNDPALGIVPFHVSAARAEHLLLEELLKTYQINSYYENLPLASISLAGVIDFTEKKSLFGHVLTCVRFPSDIKEFRHKFAPFVEFSRGCPIGSIYAKTHLQEFTKGVFNKPILQDRGFVVPAYFRRKAQEHVYGLRKMRKTLRGISFNKTGLIDLYRRFESADLDVLPLRESVPSWLTSQSYDSLLRNDSYVFKDLSSGTRVLLVAGRAMSFRYNRHSRVYDKVHQVPVADWISEQCERLRNDFRAYYVLRRQSVQTYRERDEALDLCVDLTGFSLTQLRERYSDRQSEYLRERDKVYNSTHTRLE